MSNNEEARSLPELLGGLASDISNLFRKEIQLAKAEVSEKAADAISGVTAIAIGGVLAIGALGVLLAAVVALLAALLVRMGIDPTLSNALSALVVGVVVGLIGWGQISKGLAAFKATNLNLARTTSSLGRDADIVKERL